MIEDDTSRSKKRSKLKNSIDHIQSLILSSKARLHYEFVDQITFSTFQILIENFIESDLISSFECDSEDFNHDDDHIFNSSSFQIFIDNVV